MNQTREPLGGWPLVKFGEVVRNVRDVERNPLENGLERYVGLEHLDPESLHIRRWGLIADGTSFTRKFTKGQVLFGKRRAYQRKAAVAEFHGLCSGDILVFEPKDDRLLPELLPFIVQSEGFYATALRTSAGSLSPRTRWRDLAAHEFLLPPLDEQRRIAEILWAADEAIEKGLATKEALVKLQRSMIEEFLTQGMPGWHTEYRETRIGSLPRTWDHVRCERILVGGPRNGLSPKVNASGKGYPTLSISAIRDGKVVVEGSLKYAEIPAEEAAKFRLQAGDLLVVRGNGNRDLVGRCGMVETVPEGCFYPDLLIRIKFDPSRVRAYFACTQWNTPLVHRKLLAVAQSTSGIWKINGKNVRQHRLIVPPLKEQDAFLRLLQPQLDSEKKTDEHIERTQEMKRHLIDSLLDSGSKRLAGD